MVDGGSKVYFVVFPPPRTIRILSGTLKKSIRIRAKRMAQAAMSKERDVMS